MKAPRRRRAPAAARGEILAAASRVLAEHPPDAVGLADVAREAGVSHALVSHYFGTYVGLVDAVLEARRAEFRGRVIARLSQSPEVDPDELLDGLFEALSDRSFVRLSLWALAAERPSASGTFPLPEQGLREVAEAICARIDDRRASARARVEQALVVAGSAALGYAAAQGAWAAALGREPTTAFDRGVRRALGEMLRAYLAPLAAREH